MKLGCIGDVHLRPDRLADQVDVLRQAFELFRSEGCDAVLVAGDIWHGPTISPELYVTFARALDLLDGIPVVAISGNGSHDAATRDVNALAVFDATYPRERLHVCCRPELVPLGDVTVACLPWASVAQLRARLGGGQVDEVNAWAADLVLSSTEDLRSQVDGPAVLLGHWSVSGASLPTGLPVDLAREPILDAEFLREQGWDAVVFGHVHRSQEFFPNGLYVGSPLCLDHGESGFEHGVYIVTVDAVGTQAEFFALESRPFRTIDCDEADVMALMDNVGEFAETVADAVVRVRYTATPEQARRIDTRAIIAALKDAGAHKVTVEPTVIRESVARVPGLSEDVDDYAAFDAWLAAEGIEGGRAALLKERHREYVDQVPA